MAGFTAYSSPPSGPAGGGLSGSYPNPGLLTFNKQAATPLAGFALQNATPNILSWNVPNDGVMHRLIVISLLVITVAETGGAYGVNLTEADGTVRTPGLSAGGGGAGTSRFFTSYLVQPNTTATLLQTSALTAGTATVWAEMWAL